MPEGIRGSSPICSVAGCTEKSRSNSYCPKHYSRWKRHGDPLHEARVNLRWPENLLARMEPQPNGCTYFTGALDKQGYGILRSPSGQRAHRSAYEHFIGAIPEGLTIDHECHNRDETCAGGPTCLHRRCVNPDHLAAKPAIDNINASPNSNAAKTHCPQGHPYDEANTHVGTDGRRVCRSCQKAAKARHNARRLAEG